MRAVETGGCPHAAIREVRLGEPPTDKTQVIRLQLMIAHKKDDRELNILSIL